MGRPPKSNIPVQQNTQNSLSVSEDLLDIHGAMSLLKVKSRQTMYTLIDRDKLPYVRVGGQLRFIPSSLMEWVRQRETHSA
jgi:excisionase family DNA binding protein